MSIKEKIAKEFNRTPVTASSAVVAIFVAMGSFIVAVLQYKATSITATASFEHTQVSHFNISNFLLILSYFSAVSIIGASFVRLLARKHDFHALVLSIPIAALINFSTFIVLNLAPPTKFTSAHLASANDLIF